MSVRKTLKKIEVSKSTFYEWYGRYLEDGLEGLVTSHIEITGYSSLF